MEYHPLKLSDTGNRMPSPQSMTGYGRQEAAWKDGTLVVEIRSVNHRFLDIACRIPKSLSSFEEACKEAVERIARKNGNAARDLQVGFLALRRDGAFGAYALQDGFTYAVKDGRTDTIHKAPFLS